MWFNTDQLSRLSDNDASVIESQFLMMIRIYFRDLFLNK